MKMLLLILELLLVLAGIYLIASNLFPLVILLLFIMAWVSLRLRHLSWRLVGLKKPDHVLTTIALALLVGCAYQALDTLAIAPLLQRLTGEAIDLSQFAGLRGNLPILIASLLLTWTEAAFIEEMFFRAYLFNRLTDLFGRKSLGVLLALVTQAILFGLGHTYQGVTGVFDTALAGLVIGLLYLRGKGNLWLPILTHGIIDTIGFLLIFLGLAA
ncbi:MAG TPA: CPBP family intramembrane glutamic endopeptidase [Anaerolineales bacterium]|nr:CPBP family intramembrane glutamic endopeptidase [Anaerolineales bacterium]